jgi:hypothetical protein
MAGRHAEPQAHGAKWQADTLNHKHTVLNGRQTHTLNHKHTVPNGRQTHTLNHKHTVPNALSGNNKVP